MRKLFTVILLSMLFVTTNTNIFAGATMGLFGGFSSPNNEFNNLKTAIDNGSDVNTILREGMSTGYHVGAVLRYSLTEDFFFTGKVGWHKFPETDLDVINPNTGDTLAQLTSTQNIIPITAGINFYVLNSVVGVYGIGELSYNYLYSSIDAPYGDVPVEIDKSPTESRVGFGFGAGVDIDVFIATLNLEAKYNIANFIGKVDDEETKQYFSISLGFLF